MNDPLMKSVISGRKSGYDGFIEFVSALPPDKIRYVKNLLNNGLFRTFANMMGAGGMYDSFINEVNRRFA